ncbi:bi-domain-containing oxidoreductase [bacterium]|nr:bi-domain-containing oxidoreductase [bacterium]
MKQVLQNFKTGKLELVEVPIPTVKPGFILVKNYYSLISPGTERATIELAKENIIGKAKSRPDQVKQVINKIKTDGIMTTFQRVMKKLDEPLPLGYSSAGEVIKIGENVEGFEVGDRVACAGGGYASHAEIVAIPKNLCVKIPENVSYQKAAFTTLGAIAMQGIRRANLTPGEKVAVIGLGLIGQLTCQILKAYKFQVLGFDINHNQVKRAIIERDIDAGDTPDKAEDLVKSFTQGKGIDAVIIAAATKSNGPIELAGKILRNRGRVSAIGDIKMDVPRRIYYKKELDLRISRSYGPGRYDKNYEEKGQDYPFEYVRWTEKRNMEEFLRLVNKRLVQPKKRITHIFNIEKAKEAYELILNNPKKEEIISVLFLYNPEKEQKNTIFFKEREAYKPKNQVNVGIIGIGNFAQNIALPILKKIKGAHLYAAADAKGINAQKAIKQFKGNYATTDWHKITGDKNIDLVIVTTRHNIHAPITIEALKNNKNVHVEKPLCLNEEELKNIIKATQKSEGRLMVGFNRRFAPHIVKAKEAFKGVVPLMILCRINAGFIPKDSWVHDPVEGGGRIIGEACHFINLCQFLINSSPKKIYASLIPIGKSVQTEDNIAITIDFKNGSRGMILYTSGGPKTLPKEYIEIIGGSKAMIIDNFKSSTIYSSKGKKRIRGFSQNKGHLNEFKSFIKTIQQGRLSPIPLKEIVLSMQTTFNAIKSAKEKRIIDISNIRT